MKKIVIAAIIFTIAQAQQQKPLPPNIQEGVKAIKLLGSTLKSNLQRVLKKDKSGMKALKFCILNATKLTAQVNKKLPPNIKVRRVSLNYRNEANKADAIDAKVLEEFKIAVQEKIPLKKPEVVDINGTKRVYKALIVTKKCLKCHGSAINHKLAKMIHKHYPNDKAIGYKEGDLRGAIVAEIKK